MGVMEGRGTRAFRQTRQHVECVRFSAALGLAPLVYESLGAVAIQSAGKPDALHTLAHSLALTGFDRRAMYPVLY